MAALPKMYLPEEVAEFLRLSRTAVIRAAERGEIKGAIRVQGEWRFPESALLRIIGDNVDRDGGRDEASDAAGKQVMGVLDGRSARDSGLKGSSQKRRNTSPEQVRRVKEWVWKHLREVAPDLRPYAPRKEFTANGNQGALSVATTEEKGRDGWYFFGFPQDILNTGLATFLVAAIGSRDLSKPCAFVIPCEKLRSEIDGWSVDKRGDRKYHIERKAESYYLNGTGMQPVAIGVYLNAFHLLR